MNRTLTLGFLFAILTLSALPARPSTQDAAAFKLVSSSNPSSYGDPVSLTAILPEGTVGTVTFKAGSTTLATTDVVSGQATCTTSALSLGSHAITATYKGQHNQSSVTLTQTVHQADPTVVLTCGPNWSIFGESIDCDATLPADGTGIVSFFDNESLIARVNAVDGSAAYTLPKLTAGRHLLTASYNGDSNYRASNGRQLQTILQADSYVRITCTPNPAWYGEAVRCTAEAPIDATGSIKVTASGLDHTTFKLVDGTATWTMPLPVGRHFFEARYLGDANYHESATSMTVTIMDPEEAY